MKTSRTTAFRIGGTGKSHLAQAIGQASILQGNKVLYRQTHILLEEVGEATLEGQHKQYMESISSVALLIIDESACVSYRRRICRRS